MITNDGLKSKHQMLVEMFTRQMSSNQSAQSTPTRPSVENLEKRVLRAALILEEALEVINLGLGLSVTESQSGSPIKHGDKFLFAESGKVNLIELAGNLADLDVVGACGTASAFGIAQEPITTAICANNLLKFAPGHSYREDGKLIKLKNHPKPEPLIMALLKAQGARDEDLFPTL